MDGRALRNADRAREARASRSARLIRSRILLIGAVSVMLYVLAQSSLRSLSVGSRPILNLALYWTEMIALFCSYIWVLFVCNRGKCQGLRVKILVFGLPIVFNCILLFGPPLSSIDVFSYISHGYISAELDHNPYGQPSSIVADAPLGHELSRYGWRPVHPVTPYGPLWTQVETLVVRLTSNVPTQIALLKSISALCSLGSAVLIWLILGRMAPEHKALGTIAYLWNPLIIGELAGEGHNDGMMVFLVLLALGLTVFRREGAGIVTMFLAVLTKYLPLMFLPLQAVHTWRTRLVRHPLLLWCSSIVISAAIALPVFAPFWIGRQTFTGLRLTGQSGNTGSTQTLAVELVSRIAPDWDVRPTMLLIALGLFVVYVGAQARRVLDDASLMRGCAWVATAYVLLAAPSYWPWYAVLPVALLALNPRGRSLWMLLTMSLGARLIAPLDQLYVHEVMARPTYFLFAWLGGIGLPLLIVAVLTVREWLTVRNQQGPLTPP
jgi:alpha-1,6-mannosyltransferase